MILAVMFVIIIMAMMAASSLSYSLNSYRQSMRTELIDKARIRATSDMEVLYFEWQKQILSRTPLSAVPAQLGLTESQRVIPVSDDEITPNGRESWQKTGDNRLGWVASRSLGSSQAPAVGVSAKKIGQVVNFEAKTQAVVTDPVLGAVQYRIGRRFAFTNTSIFQFSVFYQGTMEFGTGSAMTIRGDISGNGAVFIGSQLANQLTVVNNINYLTTFNGAADESSGTSRRSGAAGGLFDPIFKPDSSAATPEQVAQRKLQVNKLEEAENFLGGVSVERAMKDYGQQYNTDGTIKTTDAFGNVIPLAYQTENDIYRSVIAPPSLAPPGTDLRYTNPADNSEPEGSRRLKENAVIAATRMYNKAGLVFEVSKVPDGTGKYPVKIFAGEDRTVNLASSYPTLAAAVTTRKDVFDSREKVTVKMTDLDVGALGTAIKALSSTDPVRQAYNGVVYLFDPNPEATTTSGNTTVRSGRNGVRLTNGAKTPYFDKSGNPLGFTVASDNGLYIKGDFNTQRDANAITANKDNLASVMGDAVTVLSNSWNDDNSTLGVNSRVATTTTVKAAILTGNTATKFGANGSIIAGTNSGGVQNLVRLMEDWRGQTFTLNGSLGQLFESKFFNSAIRGTGANTSTVFDRDLYWAPAQRNLTFDERLAESPPNGTPTTTTFRRGAYFTW